jgi:hypothetical protein
LPDRYRILPADVDFRIPGFSQSYRPGSRSLALRPRDPSEWFADFVDLIETAIDERRFLPVCRMSDGEFQFVVGDQPLSVRLSRRVRLWLKLRQMAIRLRSGGAFVARTRPGVSSGRYSEEERRRSAGRYAELVREISREGVLALHLSYGPVPFQEPYFPAIASWLAENGITLSDENYFPFYFVYALLSGPERHRVMAGRRLLLVNAADPEKSRRIEEALISAGAASVDWCPISASRALYDQVDVSGYRDRVDVALVGAGVGKPNILMQLRDLSVPCLDAGFMFEVWSDSTEAFRRPYCADDSQFRHRDRARASRRTPAGSES